MALRNFIVKLATSATGSSLIKTANEHRGVLLKGIIAGTGLTITEGANDITIDADGSQAITGGTITGATLSGNIYSDIKRQSATFSATSGDTGTTLTNLTGLVHTVVPGTYRFTINLGTVSTANSGLKVAFKYTTAVLTSIEYEAVGHDAAASVASRGTTATDQASLLASTSVILTAKITGTMVVATGGTVQVQAAQNASHADTTSVFLGSTSQFERIA